VNNNVEREKGIETWGTYEKSRFARSAGSGHCLANVPRILRVPPLIRAALTTPPHSSRIEISMGVHLSVENWTNACIRQSLEINISWTIAKILKMLEDFPPQFSPL